MNKIIILGSVCCLVICSVVASSLDNHKTRIAYADMITIRQTSSAMVSAPTKEVSVVETPKDEPVIVRTGKVVDIPQKWQSHYDYVNDQVKDNKSKLSTAVAKYKEMTTQYSFYNSSDCHPYIIGAIHYREHNFALDNGWNGQGMLQNTANKYGSNSIVTDATAQVDQACKHLQGKAKNFCQEYGSADDLKFLENIELIGCALARYNGCSNNHYNQCGYTVNKLSKEQSNFTKCSIDYICYPVVQDTQLGGLTIILGLMISK